VNNALRGTGVELDNTPIARESVYRALEGTLVDLLENA
jgi:carbon-monoxide dehydrogenase large subunit